MSMSSRKSRQWLIVAILALLALELIYVVGANLFLNSETALQAINNKPQRLWLHWQRGWTILPGVVHVSGLQIRGQDRQFQWYAELDKLTAWVSLPALVNKHFRTHSMNGRGLSFRMRRRLAPGAAASDDAELTPDIPGLSNPPKLPPEELYPAVEIEHPWTIELRHGAIADLREIWVNQFRFEGHGQVEGGMTHVVQRMVAVPRASVTLTSGTAWVGKTPAIENVTVKATATLDQFDPRKEKGPAMLPFITASVQVKGKVDSLEFIRVFFRKAPWLRIQGQGQIDADLRLHKGVLAPPTVFSVKTEDISTNVLDLVMAAKGPGGIEGRVERADGQTFARVSLALADFQVALPSQQTLVRGHDLQITGKSTQLDLRDPFTDLLLIADAPDLEFQDLTVLNAYIPRDLNVQIRAGRGHLRSHVEGSPQNLTATGTITLSTEGLVASYRDLTLLGNVDLTSSMQYGLLEDETEGVLLRDGLPLELAGLGFVVKSGELRERQHVIARELELDLDARFAHYELARHELRNLLGATTGELRLSAKMPELRDLTGYLPKQSHLLPRAGVGDIRVHLRTAPREPEVTGSFAFAGHGIDTAVADHNFTGDLKLDTQVQYGWSQGDGKGLRLYDGAGHLELVKAAVTVRDTTLRKHKLTIAHDVTLDANAEFGSSVLRLDETSKLLRATRATVHVAGNLPNLGYLRTRLPLGKGLTLNGGRAQFDARLRSAPGEAVVVGHVSFSGTALEFKFKNEMAVSGDVRLGADVRYGASDGLVLSDAGPLATPKISAQLSSGRLLLRDGKAVEHLAVSIDSSFDHVRARELDNPAALRAVSATVDISGRVPDLRFLRAYFRQAPWLRLDGAGEMLARVQVEKGVLMPGTQVSVDSQELHADFMDYQASGSGTVRGSVTREAGETFSSLTVSLNDFEFGRLGYKQPYIFGTGFAVKGTARQLDLTDPFTDLKVTIDLPESKLPNFAFYNAYVPPDSCIYIYQGHGSLGSHFDFDAASNSASGNIALTANKVIMQFDKVTLATDLKVNARLKDGDMQARSFDMSGTTIELSNTYVGSSKIETDTSWWGHFELPKAKGTFTIPAQLDARVQMSLRDSRPVVVFLAEKKGVVKWFKNLLTVPNIEASADVKMQGKMVQVQDLAMTGDRFEILGDLDIEQRRLGGVFYARLRNLSVAVELRDDRKKWKLTNSKAWYEERKHEYKAHDWFAEQNGNVPGLSPERDAVVTKEGRKKSKRGGCWDNGG
jgi:hypothetical protein